MDLNLIRSLETLALFVLFVVLFFLVFNKKNKSRYEEAANLIFDDGDERSEQVKPNQNKVNNHE